MALKNYVLKNGSNDAIIKVQGNAGSYVIELSSLCQPQQEILEGKPPKVWISGLQWSGNTDGVISIKRGEDIIATLQTNNAGALELFGQMMVPDNVNETEDIKISVNDIQCELWIRLKKIDGYKNKIETDSFGIYDNPNKSGE